MKTTKESSLDIVYGVHAVTESLEANTGNKLYIQDDLRGKNVDAIKALAAEKKVSISWTPKKTLSDMTGGAVHQGFVLRVSEFAYSELSVIMDKAEQEENPLVLILDGLNDPHNFGSILRTADATQVTGVIIPKHRAVGVTPVVAKTSTGAVEHIPIARVTNLSQTLDKLKKQASGCLERIWMGPHLINGIQLERLALSLVMKVRESLLTSRNKWMR